MTTETPNTDATPADADAVETTALGAGADAAATTDDKADDKAEVTDDKGAEKTALGGDDDKPEGNPFHGAPDGDYDTAAFEMPEGVEFDSEAFQAIAPELKELGLSQEGAGKLMSTYAEKIVPMIEQRTQAQFDENASQLRADLARDLQADPEVGGKNFDEAKAYAAKAISHFLPDATERGEFNTFMNESGLGNHPLLFRLVSGAGRALSEASLLGGEAGKVELTTSEKFYGKKS